MAFGIPGITTPPQAAPTNPLDPAKAAGQTDGTGVRNCRPVPADSMTRSQSGPTLSAYQDAIAKAHEKDQGSATGTNDAQSTSQASTLNRPTTKQTQVTSVSSTDHGTNSNQLVADRSLAAKVSTTAPPMPPSVRSTDDRVHTGQPHEQPDPLQQLSQTGLATTTATVSRGSAIVQGALEFNPATAFATLAGGALLTATQVAQPLSRERGVAIGDAENKQFGGGTSDRVFSPYSNLQADQARPTQAQLDSRALAPNALAPQPRPGPAPGYGVAADHPAAGTMLEQRDARTLAPFMLAGASVQEVSCNKPPKPEYDATRSAFKGTLQNRFQDGVKADYVKHIAQTKPDELRNLGFSDSQIKDMAKEGRTPKVDGKKVEVHHRMPLECGGTNDFENLTLVRQDVHRPLTEAQGAATQGLEYGQSRQVELLMTQKGTMYPSTPDALNAPTLDIPK